MIFLAAIPGNLIFLIVMAAVGVVNWWLEKRKQNETSRKDAAPPRHAPLAGGESEQERLRRFLEALGVPQQPGGAQPTPKPPAAPAPAPLRAPAPQPAAVPSRTLQRPITSSQVQRRFRPKPVVPAPRPVPARVPVREPEEMGYAGRLEEPAKAIENISGEFERVTVAVTMQPIEAITDASTQTAPAIVTRRPNAPIIENLRLALRTPSDLRTALVTMEVLGLPKGLQR
jgi:hypothetical protein